MDLPDLHATFYGIRVIISTYKGGWARKDGHVRYSVRRDGPPVEPIPMVDYAELSSDEIRAHEERIEAHWQILNDRILGRVTIDDDGCRVYGPEGTDGFSGGMDYCDSMWDAIRLLILQDEISRIGGSYG